VATKKITKTKHKTCANTGAPQRWLLRHWDSTSFGISDQTAVIEAIFLRKSNRVRIFGDADFESHHY
jgi:hypothetical protein